jgi:L-ascorbate metabolism protein UlaG (beta-lactamase superfamily)
MKLTFFGHSAFALEVGGRRILIDPFLTGNPLNTIAADQVQCDYIVVSHGHGDHVGDTVQIAQRTNALVISNHEICQWLQKQGVPRTHDMHLGGSLRFDFGTLKLTIAHHGSVLPDGTYGGNPAGLLFKTAEGNVYHAGDTALFSDMSLIGAVGLKAAILPVGDNYTMGPEDSLAAIRLLQPQLAIPCHYSTFPVIEQDITLWAEQVRQSTSAAPLVMAPGSTVEL